MKPEQLWNLCLDLLRPKIIDLGQSLPPWPLLLNCFNPWHWVVMVSCKCFWKSKRKCKWIWTWANWLLGWCSVHARIQSGYGSDPGVCGSRPSQLRTGLWAANAKPIMGYATIVQPHVSSMGRGTWPTNLQSSIAVVPFRGCGLSCNDYVVPLA